MARCCGSTGTCACKIEAGRGIVISGMGTSQDPFVLSSDRALDVEDTPVFDLTLVGEGTLASPWRLSVNFAAEAQLTDLPDVDAPAPANGNVLSWNNTTQMWEAAPPAVATPGGNLNDGQSVAGDGSAGSPLRVVGDAARFIGITASGVGLTDAGINRLVRPFADAATRAAATTPVPTVGALSILANVPGRLDYWDGDEWRPITNGIALDVQPGQLLELSGPYNGGTVTQRIEQVSATTDANGEFELLSALDLTTYAGVLSVQVQPVGTVGWTSLVRADTDRIVGKAFRLDDGTPYVGFVLTAVMTAMLY